MISGRAAITSLDSCDFLKKKSCEYFVDKFREGAFEGRSPESLGFYSKSEMIAILKHRTELLTLERLLLLISEIDELRVLRDLKLTLLRKIVEHKEFDSIKINKEIKECMRNNDVETLSIDFLAGVCDRLEIFIDPEVVPKKLLKP